MNAFDLAQRYVGIQEIAGDKDHPLIQWWLSLCFDGKLDLHDETPWCSAFVNGISWELNLPRSRSARARSCLLVGTPISLDVATPLNDVVILNRGGPQNPGIIDAPGHVGFFAGREGDDVLVLAGNQGNAVGVRPYPAAHLLGVRRLA